MFHLLTSMTMCMSKDWLPYEDMGYVPPPNRYDNAHAQGWAAI
jgi:hypothetical protein